MRSGLSVRLRTATAKAHRSLEATMPPLADRPTATSFRAVLRRFYGFHRVWESGLDRHASLEPLLQQRGRLSHLARDLAALGDQSGALDRLPRCSLAAELTADADLALGSLYVMEGSTLGGQIISRALTRTDWAPPEGLSYFNPYGARTGVMWRALQAALDASPEAQHDRITEGALQTFAVLESWMAEATSPHVSADPQRAEALPHVRER